MTFAPGCEELPELKGRKPDTMVTSLLVSMPERLTRNFKENFHRVQT